MQAQKSTLKRSLGSRPTRRPVKSAISDEEAYDFAVKICFLTYTMTPQDVISIPKTPLSTTFLRTMRKSVHNYPYRNMHSETIIHKVFVEFSDMLAIKDIKDDLKSEKPLDKVFKLWMDCVQKVHSISLPPNLNDKCRLAFVKYLEFIAQRSGSSEKYTSLQKTLHSLELDFAKASASPNLPFTETVSNIFNLTDEIVKDDVLKQWGRISEKDYVEDLKKLSVRISTDNAALQKFEDQVDYLSWKEKELANITQLILSSVLQNTTLAGSANNRDSSANPDDTNMVFIPTDPTAVYRIILKKCIEQSLAENEAIIASNAELMNPVSSLHIQILSKENKEFLSTLYFRWRVRNETRNSLILDITKELYLAKKISFAGLANILKLQAQQSYSPYDKENPWTVSEKLLYANSLKVIHGQVMCDFFKLIKLIFEPRGPQVLPTFLFVEKFIYPDPLFEEPVSKFNDCIAYINHLTQSVSVDKFKQLLEEAGSSKEDSRIYRFGILLQNVLKLINRIDKRYHLESIVQDVNISRWSSTVHIDSWGSERLSALTIHYASVELPLIRRYYAEKQSFPAVEDVNEIYKHLCKLRDIRLRYNTEDLDFNIEDLLAPFLFEWVESIANVPETWVDSNFNSEKFVPLSDELRHSVSTADMYKSFHQQISLIRDLNWKDEYHNAQMYTAIMGGISNAIRKYCRLLQESFERDIHTSSNEKHKGDNNWLMAARHMTSRKVFQPYNFTPETFVKFNNIEYVKTQLDKLESSINSAKLAEIIKIKGPRQTSKQSSHSYIFNIEIGEAEDLRACDSNGYSDPYVEIIDNRQKKRVAKTRTIQKTLDPVWNESFEYVVKDGSTENFLIVRVWDEDLFGTHDECGQCTISLNPRHFQDFVPKVVWYDLKPQGKIRLTISMEKEGNDIQFFFGKSFKEIRRVEEFMVNSITEKFQDIIRDIISYDTLKSVSNRKKLGTMSRFLGGGYQENEKSVDQKEDALDPLFDYLNANFETLAKSLSDGNRITIMASAWNAVLMRLDELLLPPLSSKSSKHKILTSSEVDIVMIWLNSLKVFFHGEGSGPSIESLEGADLYKNIELTRKYYDFSIENLQELYNALSIATIERLHRQEVLPISQMLARSRTVMAHKNLGTIMAEQAKLKEAQQEGSIEEVILRIMRLRGEDKILSAIFEQRKKLSEQIIMNAKLRLIGRTKAFNRRSYLPPYQQNKA
ncbi:hypothetical protein V1511DRAFT_501940 [Dipodascopsis uninucleata]